MDGQEARIAKTLFIRHVFEGSYIMHDHDLTLHAVSKGFADARSPGCKMAGFTLFFEATLRPYHALEPIHLSLQGMAGVRSTEKADHSSCQYDQFVM